MNCFATAVRPVEGNSAGSLPRFRGGQKRKQPAARIGTAASTDCVSRLSSTFDVLLFKARDELRIKGSI